jgi:hypothetical protein
MMSEDLVWILSEIGATIEFQSQVLPGIVDWDAEKPPSYGYEGTLSNRWHEVTCIRKSFTSEPKRGDLIRIDGKNFRVDFVRPGTASETITLTVIENS